VSSFGRRTAKTVIVFLTKGSRIPEVQDVVFDIKPREQNLDIKVVPVWTPRSQERIVEADLGSKLSTSTDEWCIDRRDLANVFSELKYFPNFDCMATRKKLCLQKVLFEDSADRIGGR
jgi:hypothetical protein